MIERVFGQGFGLLLFSIQAPLLGPHAFGLVATVMVFIGFWEAVPGAAALDALISIRAIDRRHFSAITLLASLLGVVLAAILYGISQPLAALMGDATLVPIMRAMALLPLAQAVTIAPIAAAQREMDFASLTMRTVFSFLAGGAVGLAFAIMGFGVWALVWQNLVQRVVAVIVLWLAVPTLITASVRWQHIADIAEFALPNMASRTMSWASGQVPRLILSLVLGPTKLGIFTLATRLHDMLVQIAILPKATVARVDLRQFDQRQEALGPALRHVFQHIALLAFPMCIGGAVIIRPLVDIWLDPRWHDAIPACQMMLLMGMPFVSIYVSASLLLAFNFQDLEAVLCTGQSIATIAGVWIAAPYGVTASVAAMLAVSVLTVPVVAGRMHRNCGVSYRDIVAPQLPSLLAALSMGGVILLLQPWLSAHLPARQALMVQILGGGVLYVALSAAMAPYAFRRLMRQVAASLTRRPGSPPERLALEKLTRMEL